MVRNRKTKEDQPSEKVRDPGLIYPSVRAFLALAGIGSGLIGYCAIMRESTPEVGGVAFVALAGVFIVLAVFGRIPRKVSGPGGTSIEFDLAERVVKATEDLPAQSKIAFAVALREKVADSPALGLAADAISSAGNFEAAVIAALRSRNWVQAGSVEDGGRRLDAVIVVGGKRYGVEVKAIFRGIVPAHLVAQAEAYAKERELDGVLIIVPDSDLARGMINFGEYVVIVPLSTIDLLPSVLR